MVGLGTIINCGAIVLGGALGLFGGKWLNERCQETIIRSMGICVLFISIAGALEQMLRVENGSLLSGGTLIAGDEHRADIHHELHAVLLLPA